MDWRAGPVKGAAMGFKNFIIKQPLDHDYIRGLPLIIVYTCLYLGIKITMQL